MRRWARRSRKLHRLESDVWRDAFADSHLVHSCTDIEQRPAFICLRPRPHRWENEPDAPPQSHGRYAETVLQVFPFEILFVCLFIYLFICLFFFFEM